VVAAAVVVVLVAAVVVTVTRFPVTGLEGPLGSKRLKVVRLSALRTGHTFTH